MSVNENDMIRFIETIEDRFDACCDKKVAELLRELVYCEIEQKHDEPKTINKLKIKVDNLILEKFDIKLK